MKLQAIIAICVVWISSNATTFTEFYCDAGAGNGTNINSGSTTNSAPVYHSENGNWDGTSIFTPTDNSTPASTVSAGMWAAVFVDNSTNLLQSSAGGFLCLITNVAGGVNGAITIDRTAFAGTAPSNAGGRTIRVGGCWAGPYRTINFPFGFIANTATNGTGIFPRTNFRAGTYSTTAVITQSKAGPMRFQGMTSVPGDGGKATIDGGSPGTSFTLMTWNGANCDFCDFILQNNGTGGSLGGLNIQTGTYNTFQRIIVRNCRISGFIVGAASTLLNCESCTNNTSNGSNRAGFEVAATGTMVNNCYAHDNTGGNSSGIYDNGGNPALFLRCISARNGLNGLTVINASGCLVEDCDLYGNASAGVSFAQTTVGSCSIRNSNFIKNGTFGITSTGANKSGVIDTCGFGSGTMTNSSGAIGAVGIMYESGSVNYATDAKPWVDPDNENFSITLATAKSHGNGEFSQQFVNSPTNTIAFIDIGAAQASSTNGTAASGGSYTFAQ